MAGKTCGCKTTTRPAIPHLPFHFPHPRLSMFWLSRYARTRTSTRSAQPWPLCPKSEFEFGEGKEKVKSRLLKCPSKSRGSSFDVPGPQNPKWECRLL